MQTKHQRKTFWSFWSWYLFNLLGWAVGISWGFNFSTFFLFPRLSPAMADRFGTVIQLGFPVLVLIICVGFAQWLILRQREVEFDIYKWIAANVKGTFIASVIFILLSAFVGVIQRPILNFLYYRHLDIDQTDLILGLISVMLPLLGSIGTSVLVAVDIFEWKFGKSNLAT